MEKKETGKLPDYIDFITRIYLQVHLPLSNITQQTKDLPLQMVNSKLSEHFEKIPLDK